MLNQDQAPFVTEIVASVKSRLHESVVTPEDTLDKNTTIKEFFNSDGFGEAFERKVISTQIPGYDDLRHIVSTFAAHEISRSHAERGSTSIIDLGSGSGGDLFRTITQLMIGTPLESSNFEHESDARSVIKGIEYVGLDDSDELYDTFNQRLDEIIRVLGLLEHTPQVSNRLTDVIEVFGEQFGLFDHSSYIREVSNKTDLVISNLLLQFLSIIDRPFIVNSVHEALRPGGAFLFVEKTIPNDLSNTTAFRNMYHDEKRRNGLSEQAIMNKEATLHENSFMNPLTVEGNIELLEQGGFKRRNIDIIWKNLHFTAFVARKGE